MVSFACDDRAVEKLLRRLVRQVTELGATIDPRTQIRCEAGSLSLGAGAALESHKPLISVPEPALLPVADRDFVVAGNSLRTAPDAAPMSPARRALLDTTIELYDRTHKIETHRATSPWLALAGMPDVLDRLVRGRATVPIVQAYFADFRAGEHEKLAVKSFLKTRTLAFHAPPRRPMPVLMPVIDFVNHHPACPGFQHGTDATGQRCLGVLKATPAASSSECFVSYGTYDALDTYLVYGFVERSAPFVRSMPLDIELDSVGRIEIHSAMGSKKAAGKLPPHLEAVRGFMPAVRRAGDGHLVVSHLLVPAGPPVFALRRILEELVRVLRPAIDRTALERGIAAAEARIVAENLRYYEGVASLVRRHAETPPAGSPLAEVALLADIQRGRLRDYERSSCEYRTGNAAS